MTKLRLTTARILGDAGLCASCAHCWVVRSDRGSVFYQCQRASNDPRYPLYPRLPVLRCTGYEEAVTSDQ